MQDSSQNRVVANLQTNSFSIKPSRAIFMAMFGGFTLMYLGIALGVPVLGGMFLLFAGILLVYGFLIGKTKYTITKEGINQEINIYIPSLLGKPPKTRMFKWEDIKSYRNDKDFSRRLQEHEYLRLYLRKKPGQIWITDQKDKAGFQKFKDTFIILAEHISANGLPARDGQVQTNLAKPKMLERKPGIYSTWYMKLITLFFVAITLGLVYYGLTTNMRLTNWFRIGAIMIPGTIYLVYRVFVKREKKDA